MSLTNIKLPDFVIADLYRRSLIQPSAAEGFPQAMPSAAEGLPQAQPEGPMAQPEARKVAEPQPVTKTPVKEPVVEKAPEKIIEAPPVKAAEPAAYKILGNNKKQITVVVNCPNDVFVPEADLQFLTKMLGACKLNMADVAIVNHATAAVAIERVKLQLQPKYVLLFGVEPGTIQLPISFPSFKEQAYAGTTYLFTPALSELNLETEDAKVLKRKLWDCLKRIFL
ncbi:MAG TPA: hypothetical protein VF008_22270 [Niastella sp.]